MNIIAKTWAFALPVLLLASCAGEPPPRHTVEPQPESGPGPEIVEFRLIEHDGRVLIQCRPVALEVGPEWVNDCNRQAEQALVEASAEGRPIEIPDPPFGRASRAMRESWETIRQSGLLESIVLRRKLERIEMI